MHLRLQCALESKDSVLKCSGCPVKLTSQACLISLPQSLGPAPGRCNLRTISTRQLGPRPIRFPAVGELQSMLLGHHINSSLNYSLCF